MICKDDNRGSSARDKIRSDVYLIMLMGNLAQILEDKYEQGDKII